MSATRIILYIKGGLLQFVTTDGPIEVTLLDCDNRDEGDFDTFDECGYSPDVYDRDHVSEPGGVTEFDAAMERIRKEWDDKVAELIEGSDHD